MYKVSYWVKNEFIGKHTYFDTLTEARFFLNRCGGVRGYIERDDTGDIIESFGDEN